MTLDEMTTDLNTRIGSTSEVANVRMQTWINQALLSFCAEHDFSWLEKKATSSTQADQVGYSLPSDFMRVVELQIDGSTSSPVPYTRTSHETRVIYPTSVNTYSIFRNELTINPTPSTSGSANIELWYIRKPTKMTSGAQSPSDSSIANMPEEYHEALVIYAFAVYNTYDEEHNESLALMGNPRNPLPGTYSYYVDLARKADQKQTRGQRSKMLSKQFFTGYTHPNQSPATNTVLGN